MKKLFLLLLAISPIAVFSQALPNNIRAQFTMERMTAGSFNPTNNDLVGLAATPGRTLGDTYLDGKWNMGKVLIKGKENMVEGYPMKYDIKAQNVEIKTKAGIRLLDVKNVGHMMWVDSITQQQRFFVNGADYKIDNVPMIGLLEILSDGKISLFQKPIIAVKQSTYNAALDVGSKDVKIYKKYKYYYNNGKDLVEINSKKDLMPAFGTYSEDVAAVMKTKKLGVKKAKDLAEIFNYYNSRVAAE